MATRKKKKKIQFFEFVDEDGSRIPDPLPWEDALSAIWRQDVDARKHSIYGVQHWGQVYTYDDTDHFVLARLREEGVSTFDIARDQIIDQESQAANPYVELSIISILPGTNKFGFVRGSNASSHAVTFGEWLNAHETFSRSVSVAPLVSRRTQEKIARAREVKLLDVRYDPQTSRAAAVADSTGLSTAMNSLVDGHSGADIEITLRQKGRPGQRTAELRHAIANTMRWVAGHPFSKAVADIVEFDDDGTVHQERIDFLNDILARRMTVSVVDEEGNPVRIPSALAAISRAADILREDLDN